MLLQTQMWSPHRYRHPNRMGLFICHIYSIPYKMYWKRGSRRVLTDHRCSSFSRNKIGGWENIISCGNTVQKSIVTGNRIRIIIDENSLYLFRGLLSDCWSKIVDCCQYFIFKSVHAIFLGRASYRRYWEHQHKEHNKTAMRSLKFAIIAAAAIVVCIRGKQINTVGEQNQKELPLGTRSNSRRIWVYPLLDQKF